MKILLGLLYLQGIISIILAFRKLGAINHASATGSVYLIDKNSIFLRAFTSSGPLQFTAATATGSVSVQTSEALNNANILQSLTGSLLTATQITVTLVSDPSTTISILSIPNNIGVP
uniref:hypothetical protein n=1 Tax=Salmonella sp. s51228 TaxID=3159652 RepID=UPI0039805B8D